MSKYDNHNTSHLPLIESVIIIAIFAVVSVFIMQLYVAADRLQDKSVNISKAMILAENAVEEYKADAIRINSIAAGDDTGDNTDEWSEYRISVKRALIKQIFYDKDWNVVSIVTDGSTHDFDMASDGKAAFYLTYNVDSEEEDATGKFTTFTVTVNDIGVLTGEKGEQLASITSGVYIPYD